MDGGPSQTDTFDPKPDAPQEYRGTFKTIATSVPGLQIAESYSKVSQLMQHACVIRGMSTTEAAEHWRARIYMHTSYRPNFAGLSYLSIGSIVSSLRPQGTGMPNLIVTGRTDQHAVEVVDRPVSGSDFMATVLTLLGIDPNLELQAGNRPVRAAAPGGKVIEEITG